MSVRFNIGILGLRAMQSDLDAAAKDIVPEARKAVGQAAELVTGQTKRNIAGRRTAAVFQIRGGRRVRRARPLAVTARPDQTGILEGALRSSITNRVTVEGRTVSAEVGSNMVYARVQEDRRSFLVAAMNQTQERVLELTGRAFRRIR